MSYSRGEVRGLLRSMYWREPDTDNIPGLVRYADIETALHTLTPKQYHAVLLCDFLGYTQDDAAWALGIHQTSVAERLDNAAKRIADYLNGDA